MNELETLKALEGRDFGIDGNRVYAPAFIGGVKQLNEEERSAVVVISSANPDRSGDILEPNGVDLKGFRRNPVVLWAHGYNELPIGKSLWEKADGPNLIAKVKFATTDFAEQVWQLVKTGFINAWSVGFIPKISEPVEQKDIPQGGRSGLHIKSWELLEYSAVPIPANCDALTLETRSRITHPILMKALGIEQPIINDEQKRELEKAVMGESEIQIKPYPDEHSCRLRDPDAFETDSMRSMEREHEGKKYRVLLGRLKGEDTMTEQAYRYPKDTWPEAEAQAHCKSHDGISFEPATGKEVEEPCCGGEQAQVEKTPPAHGELVGALSDCISDLQAQLETIDNPEGINLLKAYLVQKEGRVLSGKNRELIAHCVDQMGEAMTAMKDLLMATELPKAAEPESAEVKVAMEEFEGLELIETDGVDNDMEIEITDAETQGKTPGASAAEVKTTVETPGCVEPEALADNAELIEIDAETIEKFLDKRMASLRAAIQKAKGKV